MRILITRKIHCCAKTLLEGAGFDVVAFENNEPLVTHYLDQNIDKFDAILTCVSEKINRELIVKSKDKLRIISNMAVGLDNIDVESAKEFGISVFNTPDVVTGPTADLTIAMAFALLRKLKDADRFIRDGLWKAWDPELFLGRNFSSLAWGIIGYGNIGKAVARRLGGFEMKVSFYDPRYSKSAGIAVFKSLDHILAESDIISLHLPLTKETQGLIDMEKFMMMKRDSVIVNMARGGVINSEDLLTALENKIISGAALDVFAPEPIPVGSKILTLPNVLLTPHIGTATTECRKEMAEYAAMNIINNLMPE